MRAKTCSLGRPLVTYVAQPAGDVLLDLRLTAIAQHLGDAGKAAQLPAYGGFRVVQRFAQGQKCRPRALATEGLAPRSCALGHRRLSA